MTTNKPEAKIRDGSMTATMWKNETENGVLFNTDYERSYRDDDGEYHSSKSFSGSGNLRLSRLAQKAYDKEQELRAALREEA